MRTFRLATASDCIIVYTPRCSPNADGTLSSTHRVKMKMTCDCDGETAKGGCVLSAMPLNYLQFCVARHVFKWRRATMYFWSPFLNPQCSTIHDFPPQVVLHQDPKDFSPQAHRELYASTYQVVSFPPRQGHCQVSSPHGRASGLHHPSCGDVLSLHSAFIGFTCSGASGSSLRLGTSGPLSVTRRNHAEPCTLSWALSPRPLLHNSAAQLV